ncbi:hypothetical protein IFT84_20645 [Rhizobium sp. CFBP 8762]|uniref:hypothetical protein n=1 Tax=Rhizobium sp. CFBP 8762 TaxID=2775279 RepID=UPI001782F425|nr:hypothetical protein [Rhizobium sp. CFBP 8762]MBD8556922.1 hypothetical protein [Rhizobium sp. CFBP 8762]
MSLGEFLTSLGINLNIVLAGLAGGLLRALSRKEYKPREIIVSPLCGTLAAVNLSAVGVHTITSVASFMGWAMPADALSTERAVAFLIGVSAMWISDIVFDLVARKLKAI